MIEWESFCKKLLRTIGVARGLEASKQRIGMNWSGLNTGVTVYRLYRAMSSQLTVTFPDLTERLLTFSHSFSQCARSAMFTTTDLDELVTSIR